MILQETAGGLLLFRQTDHALLSGAFAALWGNEKLPVPARHEAVDVAAARHDDGWARWELAPVADGDGRPVDFIRIPVTEHTALYRDGIDLVEAEDAYAGLIVSLHGERLYTRPFVPGLDPRIEHLQGSDADLAHGYIAHERARQERLGIDDVRADAEEAWRLLQVWDRMSLFVCMQALGSGATVTMPPVRDATGEDVTIALDTPEPDVVTFDPYPFAEASARFEVEAFELGARSFTGTEAYRAAFRTAPRRLVRFRAEPLS
jgi:hypothetical protein